MGVCFCSDENRNPIFLDPPSSNENDEPSFNFKKDNSVIFCSQRSIRSSTTSRKNEEQSNELHHGLRHCKSTPIPGKSTPLAVSFRSSASISQRFQERKQKREASLRGEYVAQEYAKKVEDDTLERVTNSLCITGMIMKKSEDMNIELKRQGDVLIRANGDINDIELELDETQSKLVGMKSIGGKMVSMMRPHKPKLHLHGFSSRRATWGSKDRRNSITNVDDHCKVQKRISINNGRRRSISDTSGLRKSVTSSSQYQIREGVKQLSLAFDTLHDQQKDFGDEIKNQDKHFSVFSTTVGRTEAKIKCQSELINSIKSR